MIEFDTEPCASSTVRAGDQWLRLQAGLNWHSSGLPDFDDWDQAIAVVARLVASSSAPMVLMMGPRGIVFTNETTERLFTNNSGTINGRSVLEALPDLAPFYSSVLKQGLRGVSLSFRERVIRVKANEAAHAHWFNFDFTPVCDVNGEIAGVLSTASEITSYIHRIRELSESDQRLRAALDSSGMVGTWTLDVATDTSLADANVARMFGLSVSACEMGISNEHFINVIHPDDRARVKDALGKAISSATPYRCRYRLLRQDHIVSWVITSAKPVLDASGKIIRLLGVVVDVTDQMATASALEESRFQFQTLTETLPQIVWSCDKDGRHDYFSARWSEFTGIEPADITEDTWKELVYPEHQEMVASVWLNARQTGEAYDLDYRFRHRSGEYRWLRVMALPMRDDEGNITRWFGTSTDVHESYLIAEEREAFARELERTATEDQLTGVLTRRAFLERASRDIKTKDQGSKTLGLLMLDIDHFKSINDRYGHPVGDQVLAATAARITAAIRKQDFVGRLGGEEFAVFLPRCTKSRAAAIAERIRRAVEANPVLLADGRRINVTLSIGATCKPADESKLEELLFIADRALYNAKSNGRNRVYAH